MKTMADNEMDDEDSMEQNENVDEDADEWEDAEEEEEVEEKEGEVEEEDGEVVEVEEEEEQKEEVVEKKVDLNKKNKAGIVYLSTIPSGMNPEAVRGILSRYGEVGHMFLQPDRKTSRKNKKNRSYYQRYIEGWVEFKKKRIAKHVALSLNNTMVGGRRKCKFYDHVWSIKYLHRFKWSHLTERLAYEKAAFQQRMITEIAQVKKEADFYIRNVERNNKMKWRANQKMDEMIMKQKETDQEIRERKQFVVWKRGSGPEGPDQELLKSIFASGDS